MPFFFSWKKMVRGTERFILESGTGLALSKKPLLYIKEGPLTLKHLCRFQKTVQSNKWTEILKRLFEN
jgi:hypothetical protein